VTAIIVIVWTVIGLVAGLFLFGELGGLFGIPRMEGQQAIFGLLVGGPVGALCGVLFGFLLARKSRSDPRMARWLAVGSLCIVFGVPLAIYLVEIIRTWDQVDNFGGTKSLAYRIRLPADTQSPAGLRIGVELRSDKEKPTCSIYEYPHGLTREENRWIISGECAIRFATSERVIAARMGGGPNLLFRLRVQARPEIVPYSVSRWYPVDEVQDTAPGSLPRPPRPDEAGYELLMSAR